MNLINQLTGQFLGIDHNITSETKKTSYEKQKYDERDFRARYVVAIQILANEWNKTSSSKNQYYKIQFSEPNYNLKDMSYVYSTENITYFTKAGLEDIQVFAINGLFYNSDLKLYNSSKKLDSDSMNGEMIVMDRMGSLFIAAKVRGVLHHSSFFSGSPVAFAALCEIKEGKMQKMVRHSGHYKPGQSEEDSFETQLQTQYLKSDSIPPSLKIDEQGNPIQTISISSKQEVRELYDIIAKVGGFISQNMHLKFNGQGISPIKLVNNQIVRIKIEETNLKSGCKIQAFEYLDKRIYPMSLFELTINDPEDDMKLFAEQESPKAWIFVRNLSGRELGTIEFPIHETVEKLRKVVTPLIGYTPNQMIIGPSGAMQDNKKVSEYNVSAGDHRSMTCFYKA